MSTGSMGRCGGTPSQEPRSGRATTESLPPSHQSPARGDDHCPAAGARFSESCCEEMCSAPDEDTSELVRRRRARARQDLGPQEGPSS